MPSSSPAQHRLMAAVAHSPAFAKKVGIKPSVGRDFMAADKRSGKYAEGGEVKTPMLLAVPDYSRAVAYEMYPGQRGQDDQQDAARHMLAAGTLARKYNPGVAEFLGKLHEAKTSPLAALRTLLGIGSMPPDYAVDMHNNRLGIELGRRSRDQADLERLVQEAAERATAERRPGLPQAQRYAGGGAVKAARSALAALREELAARNALKDAQLPPGMSRKDALHILDTAPREPTPEEIAAEIERMRAAQPPVNKARGGRVGALGYAEGGSAMSGVARWMRDNDITPADFAAALARRGIPLAALLRAGELNKDEDLALAARRMAEPTVDAPRAAQPPVNKARGGLAQMKECACHGR